MAVSCLEWCVEQAGPLGIAVTLKSVKTRANGSEIIQKEQIYETPKL